MRSGITSDEGFASIFYMRAKNITLPSLHEETWLSHILLLVSLVKYRSLLFSCGQYFNDNAIWSISLWKDRIKFSTRQTFLSSADANVNFPASPKLHAQPLGEISQIAGPLHL